jgi:hypothetical protein
MTTGLADFIATAKKYAHDAPVGRRGTAAFVLRIGDDFAFIRLRDIWRPIRFLRQMAGAPPVRFGTVGFDPALVDDRNPARHYTAFVVAGFWLSAPLALALLLGWEVLGLCSLRWSVEQPGSTLRVDWSAAWSASASTRPAGATRIDRTGPVSGVSSE